MSNGGMRKILKYPPPAVQWIRQKYHKNLYDKNDTSIPLAHEIFSMNPLLPNIHVKPRIVNEDQEKKKIVLPTDKAIRKYIERHDLKKSFVSQETLQKEEERMAYLLGIYDHYHIYKNKEDKSPQSKLKQKSIVYENAYEFAMRQMAIQKQNPDYSEDEAVAAVEELLKNEDQKERMASRDIANTVTEEMTKERKRREVETATANLSDIKNDGSTETSEASTPFLLDSIPSILHGETQTIVQLNTWGERLKQVPYHRWTLGAATALDHWIATKILKLSTETWEDLLEGKEKGGISRARDIIAIRKSLFPETTLNEELDNDYELEGNENILDDTDKRIDELLATLQFDDEFDNDKWDDDDESADNEIIGEEEKYQAKIETMLESLQSWRERNMNVPYDEWDDIAKKEFNAFLKEYIAHVTPESEMDLIDLESTRDSLLSQPPLSRDASNSFFSKVKDETEAEIFLNQLRSYYSSSLEQDKEVNQIYSKFMSLPYDVQLAKLMTVGTLRPLYDEYTTEKDRLKFLQDYQDMLLSGIPLETLVEDEKGPLLLDSNIFGTDDKKDTDTSVTKKKRFRMDKVPYGESTADRDEVLEAWGTYKSAKASYEEKLFEEGKLGLEYEKGQPKKTE